MASDSQTNIESSQNITDDGIVSGQTRLQCECLAKKGQWEKAMAYASSVSFDYWQELTKQYAIHVNKDNPEEAAYYYMLSGQLQKCPLDFLQISILEEV